jgi:hypothetical protein
MLRGFLVITAWRVLSVCSRRRLPDTEGSCECVENLGQPTWDSPPAGGSGGGANYPSRQKEQYLQNITQGLGLG